MILSDTSNLMQSILNALANRNLAEKLGGVRSSLQIKGLCWQALTKIVFYIFRVPLEPSSQRYITDFQCLEPFEKEGLEFVILKIKGQSFMLHQIRKMIGMSVAIIRGQTPLETIQKSWDTMRIDIPRAPGLGLMLDEIHFDRYNQRFSNDGMHEGLTWEDVNDQVEAFKQDYIFNEMINTEKDEKSMFEWLKVLPIHSFDQRHFENTKHVESILMGTVKKANRLDKNNAEDNDE